MKLYVCWNTARGVGPGHPCGNAHHALREAGHSPEVVKAYGLRLLPEVFNRTEGRREVRRLTGGIAVSVLVTDDGEVVTESRRIVEWAHSHPARATASGAAEPD